MKNFISKITLLGLGMIIAIILSEGVLRVFWNPQYLNNKYKRDDLSWMKNYVILNNFGYRDKTCHIIKGKDVFRVYSLGDSYTFGWYVNEEKNAYPNIWEDLVNDKNIEIINASQPGFNLDDQYNRFINEGILFAPDLVTVGINIYDLAGREFPPRLSRNSLSDLRLYELIVNNSIRKRSTLKTDNEILQAIEDNSEQILKVKKTLEKLNQAVKSEGGRMVLVVFPNYTPSSPNSEYKYQKFHTQFQNIGRELEIEIIDLYEPFSKIGDKSKLILNPTDPHPSELANKITGEYLFERINLKQNSSKVIQTIKQLNLAEGSQFENLRSILRIEPKSDWVYFDRKFDLGVQKIFFDNLKDKKTNYMQDFLKTSKSFTHQGWPGAQIEYNYTADKKELEISRSLYGYSIVGVHQITAFYRDDGNLTSLNLPLNQISIERNKDKIFIEVKNDLNLDFYRIILDVAVKQFEVENDKVVSLSLTSSKQKQLKNNESKVEFNLDSIGQTKISFPNYFSDDGVTNYIWLNNKLTKADLKLENQIIKVDLFSTTGGDLEFFHSAPLKNEDFEPPIISYL